MLAPPYASGTVMPSTPSSPILRHRSMGNWSLRSMSAARGAISLSANERTASRNASTSSPSWKFSPGRFTRAPCLVLDVVAADHGHQRGLHGGDQLLAVAVDGEGVALDDADGAARLHDGADHAEALALGRREEIDLVFDAQHADVGRHQRRARVAAGRIEGGADDPA